MTADNVLQLAVEIDTRGANAALDGINSGLSSVEVRAVQTASKFSGGMDRMALATRAQREQVEQASRAAELLAGRIGIQLPTSVPTAEALEAGRELGVAKMDLILQGQVVKTAILEATKSGMLFDKTLAEEAQKAAENTRRLADEARKASLESYGATIDAILARSNADVERIRKNEEEGRKLAEETRKASLESYEGTIDALLARSHAEVERIAQADKEAVCLADEAKKASLDSAEKARAGFERSAAGIESFIDRIFLRARSFADIWKSLLMEMVSSTVKGFSQMAAAWWMGTSRMAPAGAGGGGLGSFLGGMIPMGMGASQATPGLRLSIRTHQPTAAPDPEASAAWSDSAEASPVSRASSAGAAEELISRAAWQREARGAASHGPGWDTPTQPWAPGRCSGLTA